MKDDFWREWGSVGQGLLMDFEDAALREMTCLASIAKKGQ